LLLRFQWITLPRPFGAGSTEASIFRHEMGQCQTFLVCRARHAWHRRQMVTTPPPTPPDETSLREAALSYLARYATTEAGLRWVLQRRIDRWARRAEGLEDAAELAAAAKSHIPTIVARMVELGLINDAAFAENRARGLALSGRSRRMIAARLMAKGIAPDQVTEALPATQDSELVSALILTRKRRIGPYRKAEPDRNRELGVLARAGFPRDVALLALAMDHDAAEAAIIAARS
jgi:regulatory protein